MKWISVEDRLPEKGQIVVVWLKNQKQPSCCKFDIDKYGPVYTELIELEHYQSEARKDVITHWMLLPDPPTDK